MFMSIFHVVKICSNNNKYHKFEIFRLCFVRKLLSERPDQEEDPAIAAIKEVLKIKTNESIPNNLIDEVAIWNEDLSSDEMDA